MFAYDAEESISIREQCISPALITVVQLLGLDAEICLRVF